MKELQDGESAGTWLMCADLNHHQSHACMDAVRRHLGKKFDLYCEGYKFLWIDQFPIFDFQFTIFNFQSSINN